MTIKAKNTKTERVGDQNKRQFRYRMLKTAREVLPKSRLSVCQNMPGYAVQSGERSAGISTNADGKAFLHGVGSCGSVWLCPVCNPKIARTRQDEVLKALKTNGERGGVCMLVTMTFSHGIEDNLVELLPKFMHALSRMKASRAYKNLKESIGYHGQTRSLEFTYSDKNGWHPHVHEIYFLRSKISEQQAKQFEFDLFNLWKKYAVKHGLGEPLREYGVNVQYSVDQKENLKNLAAYVAGWAFEVTHTHTKESTTRTQYPGMTPWEMLEALTTQKKRDARLEWLFRQFADAVHGRTQLFWSRGLKELFGINEISDETIADMSEKHLVRELDNEELYIITRTYRHSEVLAIAETAPLFLDEYFKNLKFKYAGVIAEWHRRCEHSREFCGSRGDFYKEVFVGEKQ